MVGNENQSPVLDDPAQRRSALGLGLHPIHEAAMKIAGLGLNRKSGKTRDLVALLMSHGARAWRANQPYVSLHLHVRNPKGALPVRLRIR